MVATKGENGTRPDGLLDPGEELAQRRVAESKEAARIVGVHRLEFLGYRDSGMSPATPTTMSRSQTASMIRHAI